MKAIAMDRVNRKYMTLAHVVRGIWGEARGCLSPLSIKGINWTYHQKLTYTHLKKNHKLKKREKVS